MSELSGPGGWRAPAPHRRRLLYALAGAWVLVWLFALSSVWNAPWAGWREAPTPAEVAEALHRARWAAAAGCVPPALLCLLATCWRMLVPAFCLFSATLFAVLASRSVYLFASG